MDKSRNKTYQQMYSYVYDLYLRWCEHEIRTLSLSQYRCAKAFLQTVGVNPDSSEILHYNEVAGKHHNQLVQDSSRFSIHMMSVAETCSESDVLLKLYCGFDEGRVVYYPAFSAEGINDEFYPLPMTKVIDTEFIKHARQTEGDALALVNMLCSCLRVNMAVKIFEYVCNKATSQSMLLGMDRRIKLVFSGNEKLWTARRMYRPNEPLTHPAIQKAFSAMVDVFMTARLVPKYDDHRASF